MADDLEAFWQMIRQSGERDEAIAAAYLAIPKRRLRQVLLVEYRCYAGAGCLLLHIWQSPQGILFYKQGAKLSSTRNAAMSNESGRRRNTVDGDRDWRGYGGVLDDLRSWADTAVGLPLQCAHVDTYAPAAAVLRDTDQSRPGNPTKRRWRGVTPIPASLG